MFDPRNLLKRLNRLIESFVPETWTQGGDVQHQLSPKEMRRLLLSEAKTISGLLDKAFAGHGTLLKELIEDLSKKPDQLLMEQWDVVCRELLAVRRALYRLILARQSRTELLNEWNDWERHALLSKGDKNLTRYERQEMIASELRLRGIEVPIPRAHDQNANVEVLDPVTEIPPIKEPVQETALSAAVHTLADDWEPMWLKQADEVCDYWESIFGSLDAPHLLPSQAMRLAKGFRTAQANRRQADKVRKIRRYRLGVFQS